MKRLSLLGLCVLAALTTFAQTTLQHPDQFLGYPIGKRFSPHHRVLAYAEYVARQLPSRVKLIPYGTTFEGRQLLAVVVASEKNMARLEDIQTSHLKRIGLGTTATAPSSPANALQPPIAWLSYNVHGNEAISSEAFMLVLHDLLNSSNAVSQKILANAVVILDPCLNPDGHDRYVNWYNQMSGVNPDPTPMAREHSEPWPGGRYTHYLFDPNRDWAWQTQEITRQRMALYQQWMPHLHGDFHEMGPESPYYFAPSARPYHEDITPWQREFQQIIGQYNTRYFDKNGWLYFTRENYDLFYPSYGDTWPTYNGAIGMTFEQGGGGRAGLAYRKNDGDTLTLRERIDHHYTASFATLESVADRPDDIVKNFNSFFDKAQSNPVGDFKSYIIKTANDDGRVAALRKLLDNNQIRYGLAGKSQKLIGFNYQTQKNDAVTTDSGDLVISAYQPKSTLLKILFEPKSTLEDSVTYDITSWCIPYAYGLKAYGLKEKLNPVPYASPAVAAPSITETGGPRPYAYLVRWQSAQDVQFLAGLMKNKVRIRVAERAFKQSNQVYDAGTLIITRSGNERLGERFYQLVQQEASKRSIRLIPATTGFVAEGSDFGSGSVFSLKNPRVAVISGDVTSPTSMGEVWHYFDQELDYPLTLIDANTLPNVSLAEIDVLIMPQGYGYGKIMNDRLMTKLKDWVQAGGKLIAMERVTSYFADKTDFGLKKKLSKPEPKKEKPDRKSDADADETLKQYGEREREAVSEETPGSVYRVDLDRSHPLAFGYPNGYFALVQTVYDYDFLKEGWNVGYLKKDNYVAGFVGKNAKSKLNDTLLYGVQELGRGSIVYMMDNPLFRGFWYNGKLLFGNAVFMVGN
ncbi:M14 metallopeptidase family protein [Larkinella rosea]|uniref:Zinc carboxypeptidase n=1 Tax=Larkinella rosea TaxID=2025312 RepID=A0A3P1C1Z2_9BACT|nr:M14 metallopeptidase family protein [Larkinella rosea]RRB07116.1 zinc carboxypeptidase [Larkinella rosea]